MSTTSEKPLPEPTVHRVPRDGGSIEVRDFAGEGPAFALLHGFPDNSHIYDYVIPYLVAAGRRVVAIDFLGFGASDKPEGARYSFEQQLGDVEAVVKALDLERIIPVGHDAGGPAAVNFGLNHPNRTAAICLINAFYGDAPGLIVPEFIQLFATKNLKSLSRHFVASPQQFGWLLGYQRDQMQMGMKEEHKARYTEFLGPLIDKNFRQQPSSAAAFSEMTFRLHDEVAANTARVTEFRRSDVPLALIWGKSDPYLHVSVAEYMRSHARHGAVHVVDGGHWPQIDEPAEVARFMLQYR
jgi:pimeloyl-ACP methyl ester carboxylesterase